MRNIILLFLLFVGFAVNAQSKLNYSEVIQVDGVDKAELYNRAINWFTNSFRSPNNVIQYNDKDAGQITAKALFEYNPTFFVGSGPVKGYIRYTVSIYVKDGRYKYEITDFTHDPTASNAKSVGVITDAVDYPGVEKRKANQQWMDNTWKDIKEQAGTYIVPISESIKTGMQKVSEVNNDDW